jgi:hypothetical protein
VHDRPYETTVSQREIFRVKGKTKIAGDDSRQPRQIAKQWKTTPKIKGSSKIGDDSIETEYQYMDYHSFFHGLPPNGFISVGNVSITYCSSRGV